MAKEEPTKKSAKSQTSKRAPRSTSSEKSRPKPKVAEETKTESANSSTTNEPPWWHANLGDAENPADVSSAAQEAVKLAAAVASWANETGLSTRLQGVMEQTSDGLRSAVRAATGEADSENETAPDDSGVVFTCESCPICQGMGILSSVSPEAVGGLTVALDAVTAALRETIETLTQQSGSEDSRVEHIKID